MRKWSILILLAIFSITLVACSDSGDNEDKSSVEEKEEVEKEKTETDSEEEDAEEKESGATTESTGSSTTDELTIGDKVDLDGLEIELTDVEKYEGSDFNIAENDYYLIVTLTVENHRDETANVSSIGNIEFLDSSGEEYSIDLIVDEDIEIIDGSIETGEKKVGQIVYDVKKSDAYELNYNDIISREEAKWVIPADAIK